MAGIRRRNLSNAAHINVPKSHAFRKKRRCIAHYLIVNLNVN